MASRTYTFFNYLNRSTNFGTFLHFLFFRFSLRDRISSKISSPVMTEIAEIVKFFETYTNVPQQIQILSKSAEAEQTLQQIEAYIGDTYRKYDTNPQNVYNKIAPKLEKTFE